MIASFKSTRPLGEVAKVISGYAFKSAEFGETGVPVIKIKNIRVGTVDLGDAAFVDERFLKLDAKYHVNPGDLLISLTGSHPNQPNSVVGRVARMGSHQSRCLLNQRAGKIFLRKEDAGDLGYLYYVLSSPAFRNAVAMLANGAASQANVSPTQVESLEIPLPNLSTQRKIAGILSAYDNLIENNLRRIKILEEMAQSLYREWFIHFRFPGHESAKFVDSSLGKIPEGWEVKAIEEVANIHRGRSYKSSELVDEGGLPFINLKCVVRDGGFRRDGLKRFDGPYKDSHKVIPGDIVMAVTDMTQERRIVARAARVPTLVSEFGIVSMDLVTIEARSGFSSDYLYCYFRCSDFADHLKQHANGANVLHLSPDRIKEHNFILPQEQLRNRYSVTAGLHFDQIENLFRRNDNLRQTRDLLLPKLLNNDE